MNGTSKSEVARIRQQIALSYQAANRIFHEFTPTARHAYITKHQENIEACFTELTRHMSPQEAIVLLAEVEGEVYPPPSSSSGTTS